MFWWIETIAIRGGYYRYHITGQNDFARHPADRWFSWSVPSLSNRGSRYAFRLTPVE